MFVKIGSGIFDVNLIRVIDVGSDEITVYLKGEDGDIEYTVDKSPSDNSYIDNLVAAMNKQG